MKRYSFGSFLVDDSNRVAFQTCQDVAELRPVSPMPVAIVGDAGCGKTHLLYSIVNRVRATSATTGLAYVTAHDFPNQVRALIDDPSPVRRAKSAILLVDQIEAFTDGVEELEAVVRIFLDNRHCVVVASKTHPGRLQHLTVGLRERIEAGMIVEVQARNEDSRTELIKRQVREESEEKLHAQQEEIDHLQNLLKQVGRDERVAEAEAVVILRQRLEAERGRNEDLTRQLTVAQQSNDQANTEWEVREAALREGAEASGDDEALGEQLADARAACRRLEAEADTLGDQLAAARAESEQARGEANQLLERAEHLLELIEANRARFAEAESDQRRQIAELESRLAEKATATPEELETVQRAVDEARAELENAHARLAAVEEAHANERSEAQDRFDADLDLARNEAKAAVDLREQALAEQQDLRTALETAQQTQQESETALESARESHAEIDATLESLRAERDGLDTQLAEVTERLEQQRREMEALQHEAAAQVAAAQNRAGEAEGRLARIGSTIQQIKEEGSGASAELHALVGQLQASADAAARLCDRFDGWADSAEVEPAETEAAEPDHAGNGIQDEDQPADQPSDNGASEDNQDEPAPELAAFEEPDPHPMQDLPTPEEADPAV